MFIFQDIWRKAFYLVLLMMVFFSGFILGQEVTVSARLDSSRALIGDQLTLHLKVEKSASARVSFPRYADTLTGKIEIVRKSGIDTVTGPDGKTVLNQDLLITVFDTGWVEIPSQAFSIQNGQFKDTLHTQPIALEIRSLPVDTTIRDIKANMRTPVNAQELFPYFLGLIALALLVLVIIYIVRRIRKGDTRPAEILPSEPAEVIALRQLEQLRVEKPWIQKPVKMYYINLTDILRHYIERRYHIMALEQTTDEILKDLKKTGSTGNNLEKLASILKLADLVKFAKLIPDEVENGMQVEEAIVFVKNTTPAAEEPVPDVTKKQDTVPNNVES
jgi:hypothetical protein